MHERLLDTRRRRAPVGRAFATYAVLTAVVALAAAVATAQTASWDLDRPALFVMLAVFVLVGELLPIPVPRRNGLTKVTISTAFAFAILLQFGPGPATLVYATSSVIADTRARTAPIKILFNAAEYVLSMLAASAVLTLLGPAPPVPINGGELPIVLAAAAAFFATNHVLACTAGALLADLPVGRYLRDDFTFQMWTGGCLLAFAPAAVASAQASIALVPVTFVPMVAIYIGGIQAAVNMHRAYHDSLTELPNRLMLSERLRGSLSEAGRGDRPLGVMILDLDDFKAINDTLGHEFGDQVLQQIAVRLEHVLGEGSTLARLGGDEFAAVVDGEPAEIAQAADALLAELDRPLEVESLALQVTGTIGYACFPHHGRTPQDLLRHADVALYCAKGSDETSKSYAQEQDDYSIDRLALAAQLRRGIERGELVVHYQPKVPLHGTPTHAVEALVRWQHPQLGHLGPGAFVPLAEQSGLIKLLTERVLETTLAQCQEWRAEGLDVRASVNICTRSLLDQEFPSMIGELLERFDSPASALQLEITESRVVTDMGRARAVLEQLRAMGVTVAIDDFGTGFSSLSQLQQLPIDEIKIDRSFVMRMDEDRNDEALVRSIIELGRNLGLRVTAEGVETESTTRRLHQLGCDFAQGFYLCRPVAADQCRRFFRSPPAFEPAVLAAVPEPAEVAVG
ncbi:MAG: putative bifunctional diguanylate cyclase/phosphodiesterase [Solirubrobacteraceae bacterium]